MHREKPDNNQKEIVAALRKMGVSVIVGVNDIFTGWNGKNNYFEIKNPEYAKSKTGKVRESAKRPSQRKMDKEWKGQRHTVMTLDEILRIIGLI